MTWETSSLAKILKLDVEALDKSLGALELRGPPTDVHSYFDSFFTWQEEIHNTESTDVQSNVSAITFFLTEQPLASFQKESGSIRTQLDSHCLKEIVPDAWRLL